MADDKKAKAVEPKATSKEKAAPKDKAAPKEKVEKTESVAESKSDAPKNYSRGEGQKPVTKEYKENWNAIFGKKKKKKR